MKNYTYYFLLFLYASFLLFSCKKDTDLLVIQSVPNEFLLDMYPNNQGDSLVLEFNTIKTYSCKNTSIAYEISENQGIYSIKLNNIVKNGDCVEETAPAKSKILIKMPSNGTHLIQVILKETIFNTGNLLVTDEFVKLNFNQSDGVKIVNNLMYKIPKQTVWGYIAFPNDLAAQKAVNDFETELSTLCENLDYNKGFYGYFTLKDNQIIDLREKPIGNFLTIGKKLVKEESYLINLSNKYKNAYKQLNFVIKIGDKSL